MLGIGRMCSLNRIHINTHLAMQIPRNTVFEKLRDSASINSDAKALIQFLDRCDEHQASTTLKLAWIKPDFRSSSSASYSPTTRSSQPIPEKGEH